jgi:hypothetical protein
VLALGVAFLLRGSPSESSVSASAPPSLTAPALSLESRTPANATEPANEPLPAKPAPREVLVAEPAPAEVVAAPPAASAYNAKALEGALHWGISNAEECHKGGRPAGTVKAVLTFGPAGKILQAQLEGEPIASNPVSKCILSFLRSMMIPAFTGPEFTITREITLR